MRALRKIEHLLAAVALPLLGACGGGESQPLDPPIGKHAVFVARESGRDQLYIGDTGRPGTVLAKLNAPLGKDEELQYGSASPDGRTVAYWTWDERDQVLAINAVDPLRPGQVTRWRLPAGWTSHSDPVWSSDGRWIAISAYDWANKDFTTRLVLVALADPSKVFTDPAVPLERGPVAIPGRAAFAFVGGGALQRIDLGAATPGPRVTLDSVPTGTYPTVTTSADGAWLVLVGSGGSGYTLRAARSDGSVAPFDVIPPTPSGEWLGTVGVTGGAVVYLRGAGAQPYRLYRADLVPSATPIELTPPTQNMHVVGARLAPSGDQVALSVNAANGIAGGAYTIDLATPGVATQRAGVPAGGIAGYPWSVQYVQGGTGLLVVRGSGVNVDIGVTVVAENEVVRVGARAAEGEVRLFGLHPSGANPYHVAVCDDGVTLLALEYLQFPPPFGGAPEAFPWLSEVHVARAGSVGISRLTPGYDPWRGVSGFECLPTRR